MRAIRKTLLAGAIVAAATLAAAPAFAAPSVSITVPSAGARVTDTFTVTAKVTSVTYPVNSVQAHVGAVTQSLTLVRPTTTPPTYSGSMQITGTPFGSQTLSVTATDTSNAQGSADISIFHDDPPVPTTTSWPGAVFLPTSVPVKVACTDDDPAGCASSTLTLIDPASGATTALASGNVIDMVVDLTASLGKSVRLTWDVADSGGRHVVTTTPNAIVTAAPRLCTIAGAGSNILDANATHVLRTDAIVDRRDGSSWSFPPSTAGLLLPDGAMRIDELGTGLASAPEVTFVRPAGFHPGAPLGATRRVGRIAYPVPPSIYVVDTVGNYVVGTGWNATRDLTTGNTVTSFSTFNDYRTGIAANGDVCYASGIPQHVHLIHAGVDTDIIDDPDVVATEPVCDGFNVVYRFTTTSLPGTHAGLAMRDAAGTVTVLVPERNDYAPTAHGSANINGGDGHDANGGWVVFSGWDAGNAHRWYRRDPAGAVTPLSNDLTVSTNYVGLAPDGDFLLETYVDVDHWGLHRIGPTVSAISTATFVATFENTVWTSNYRDDGWYLFTAGGAYAFNRGPTYPYDCPSAPPATSGADAGVDGGGGADSGTPTSGQDGGAASGTAPSHPGGAEATSEAGAGSPSGGGRGGCAIGRPPSSHASLGAFLGLLGLVPLGVARRRRGRWGARPHRVGQRSA